VHRNNLALGDFRISPVQDFSIFTGFSCLADTDTDRDLEEFIRHDAARHSHDKIAITYTLQTDTENIPDSEPLGFATLQNDAIVVESNGDLPGVCSEYPYRSYPAVKIGRFGIRIDLQGNTLGSLFLYMIKLLFTTNNRTGCRFVTVDARRDKRNKVDVRPFYEKNGFGILPCRPRTSTSIPMYFDLKSLKNGSPR